MVRESIIMICLFLILASCSTDIIEDEGEVDRVVVCDQEGKYNYLDKYPAEEICESDTCNSYFEQWKSFFLNKNGLNSDFLNEHITIKRTSLNYWNDGISYRICYQLKVGWAIAYNCDHFIISLSENAYGFSSIPRNTLLTESQIEMFIDNNRFSSGIDTVSSVVETKFETFDDALEELITQAQVNTLCSGRIFLGDNGNLRMAAHATYENEINSCIQGSIDLITGITDIWDSPCWIN